VPPPSAAVPSSHPPTSSLPGTLPSLLDSLPPGGRAPGAAGDPSDPSPIGGPAAVVLTALGCLVSGLAVEPLVGGPGLAASLAPAAGVALAAVLAGGRRALLGVFLGTAAATLLVARLAAADGAPGIGAAVDRPLLLAGLLALAATAQAAVGGWLVERWVGPAAGLDRAGDIGRFLGAAAASSLVAATVATLGLGLAGLLAGLTRAEIAGAWSSRWTGDLAGLLVVTPVVLTLVGRPRRVTVGVTLGAVAVTLGFGAVLIDGWNRDRLEDAFDHESAGASLIAVTDLQEPLRALDALHGVLSVGRAATPSEIRAATRSWLGHGAVKALGYAELRRRDDVPTLEARARADGLADFRVFDRAGSSVAERRAAGFDAQEVVAIRLLEPTAGTDLRLGLDALSLPGAPAAIARAVQTGRPSAGELAAAPGDPRASPLVLVFQGLHDARAEPAATPGGDERRISLRGVAFVAIDPQEHLQRIAGAFPSHLALCLVDTAADRSLRRIAGPAGCERARGRLVHDRALAWAGRTWTVRVTAREADLPGAGDRSASVFCLLGTLTASLLGATLLAVTGRARRIETAVRERTAALRAEMSEREVAESALRASEQRFRNILGNVPIGVVYTDLAGRVIQANARFCELIGCEEDELAALPPRAWALPEDAAEEEALTARLVAGEIPVYRRQGTYRRTDGSGIAVRCTVSLLRDQKNRPWRIVGVVEDISERRKLEEAERAREAAEAANRAKSEFLSRMSHELRTPLNAMLGFAQLLEVDVAHPLAAPQRPWVAQIQSAGWHLLEMINDVLDLSRIESGTVRLQIERLDLGDIVPQSVALVAPSAAVRGIRVDQVLESDALGVLGDATRIKQILTNLLSNAVKYNVEGGRIRVQTWKVVDDAVEIAVSDTGLGMTDEQIASLWQPFNRLGRERGAQEGTGIGLVIARRLVELMGGSIGVSSIPGEGSTFRIRLPAAPDGSTEPGGLDGVDIPLEADSDYHRRAVHYIEDNETNVEVMRGILALRPQVDLDVSATGAEGLAAVRRLRPDLILLDMHLPDADGLALLQTLKSDPSTADVPVVVVSADALGHQIDAALAAGAEGYLTKPVSVSELLAVVDGVLERADTGFH
jgi:PAS domain S-box-containing protein